ncbi:MAG TPA: cbb3-type cytochrome c oxidase subunit 3 [Thiolinea sp.]|nr:cbb3-type cytochrome c oxidase subunit 3 [Thiolinea sp.]
MDMLVQGWLWVTDMGNSKVLALLIFFFTFIGILLYVYASRERSERLESYRYVPFLDEEEQPPSGSSDSTTAGRQEQQAGK